MEIKIISNEKDWAKLQSAWNEVLEKSATNVPFLRHEYLMTWWAHRGGAEWSEGELYIITGWLEEQLLGIAPLFLTTNRDGKRALMLLGSIEISDFLDVMAAPEDMEAFLSAMLAHLTSHEAPEWECLDWYNLLKDSPSLPVLEKQARAQGLDYRLEDYLPSPTIHLPEDFDDYLAGLEKKYRHEFRRKMRNAAGFFLPVEWYVIEEEDQIDEAMEQFAELMREEVEKDKFLTPEMIEQMKAIAHTFFQSGMLQLAFLKVGHDISAGYFNIIYDNKVWVYNSGMARKFAQLSPGVVLGGFLIMDAIEKRYAEYDMMRGDEDYKYQWGGQNRFVMRAVVER
jgi:CelD/BcsL family acetyltransferase involved in cellulose biosynthesis